MFMLVGGARIDIEKPALAFSKTSGRLNGWLGYALARRLWIDREFREHFKDEPTYRYTYDEEFYARESASKIWSELAAKDHYDDRYFSELGRIESAGFLREYVWYCVPHPEWTKPADLKDAPFASWMTTNLPSHMVETWVAADLKSSPARVVLGREAHPPTRCQVPGATVPAAGATTP